METHIIDRTKVRQIFNQYVSGYNAADPKIKLKIDHTYRVADLAQRIAGVQDIPSVDLAWLCGMLHDIGRFEQVRRYGTFIDAKSVNHAEFGADLLFREGLIERFDLSLSPEEMRLLESSIRHHNVYELPEDLCGTERTYCDILRDADKIDIYRVNYETPFEDIYNVGLDELKRSAVSEEVKECFRRGTTVLKDFKKTPVDYLVGHICLCFGLVYPVSNEIVRKQGYLDKLLAFKSEDAETAEWFRYMRREMAGG